MQSKHYSNIKLHKNFLWSGKADEKYKTKYLGEIKLSIIIAMIQSIIYRKKIQTNNPLNKNTESILNCFVLPHFNVIFS